MKKILVPTDFSKNSINALQYAIHFANRFEAEIVLVHIFETNNTTGAFTKVERYMRANAESNLSKLVSKVEKSLYRGTSLRAKTINGFVVESLCKLARQENTDLIVMGTQGATGLKEIFMGSNTEGVMKNTTIPMLVIPNHCTYQPPKNILFGVDSGIVSIDETFSPLRQLCIAFGAKVKVLHLYGKKELAVYDHGIPMSLSEVNYDIECSVATRDVFTTINTRIAKNKYDMLTMIRRDRGFWGNLFHKSVTSQEVFHSDVPLLILHEAV